MTERRGTSLVYSTGIDDQNILDDKIDSNVEVKIVGVINIHIISVIAVTKLFYELSFDTHSQ